MRRAGVFCLAVCAACDAGTGQRTAGRESAGSAGSPVAGATTSARAAQVEAFPVNRGTQGMRATVRWMLSPDRRQILVVEDAVSVEAEALPDGFLYASEGTGQIVRRDSVWDVAPSPDWTRLAFGRAYILRAGELDTVPPEEWRRLEAQLPEDVGERDMAALRRRLEAHTFPASGMAVMLGLGLTQVIWVDSARSGHEPANVGPTHSLHGWRVRWTPSGDTLGVGAAPRMVQDDAPPTRWVLVRPRLWALYTDTLGGTTDSSRFARVPWVDGPTLEMGSPVDLSLGAPLSIDGGTVDVSGGSIWLTRRGANGRPRVIIVGPGMPLAATATGRFIVALVPRTDAKEHEIRARPVVYHVP